MKNPNVYFIGGKQDGCLYVRMLQPIHYNGWNGNITSLQDNNKDIRQMAIEAMKADIVVFHRPDDEDKLKLARILQGLGKKIVFDNDDTYKIDNDNDIIMGEYVASKNKYLNDFIKMADLITTTTNFLADEYRQLNKNVVVLPNCVDPLDWPKPKRNETDTVRIGLFGSTTVNDDYESIDGLLDRLGHQNNVRLVVMGLPDTKDRTRLVKKLYKKEIEYWKQKNIEWHPLVQMKDYIKSLNDLKLDICLIPRKDNYFNRCKSNLKFLECSMLEIPIVAQGFSDGLSPYQEKIDSRFMLVAHDSKEWYEDVMTLITSKQKREEMGKEAKAYIINNYSILDNAVNWKIAYQKII